MLTSFLQSLPRLGRRWTPLNFTNPNFIQLSASQAIEEETIPGYIAGRYYPTRIGEILKDRYRRYVTLKIFIKSTSMGQQLDDELKIYKRIEGAPQKHPGRKYVRSLLDSFDISGPEDKHRCLVHPPLWESMLDFLFRNPVQRLPTPILAVTLHRLFLALDYLHTECKIIHTDIKADNIMFGIADDSVLSDFENTELQHPCPRKELDGRTIYTSRELRMPKNLGAPILCDFGSAVIGDKEHSEDIQPDIYRAPEVILQAPWSYSVDIWNVGCVIWNLFEGGSLFSGQDPEFQTYRSRAHLAEMIRLLGPPSPSFLARGNLTQRFFSQEGDLYAGELVGEHIPLEQRETSLEGEEKEMFLRLMRKMLQWEPEKRSSAMELEQDEWVQAELHK
ncbi:Pc16g03080 [Penicillium rubens Wisconsin 54-1255]|uniref:Pc16g03080 protein n=1 Tax=Penicillium rubens (strain ATCC 28089 / DSM 1075 / NRRL 1951 / Wisconsin 54-1255) TaxID=500485 RepID=B6H8X0_PENRW|nr:Pc16g03080 [Penicillium rubens Wisconsin 54-1255]